MLRRTGSMIAAIGMMAALDAHIGGALAQPPKIDAIVVADNATATASQASFGRETPKIVVQARVPDAPAGTKISAAWIAEKTDEAPPDFHIVSTYFTLNGTGPVAVFSLTKPTAGWPAGDYRVELSVNGVLAGKIGFKVG